MFKSLSFLLFLLPHLSLSSVRKVSSILRTYVITLIIQDDLPILRFITLLLSVDFLLSSNLTYSQIKYRHLWGTIIRPTMIFLARIHPGIRFRDWSKEDLHNSCPSIPLSTNTHLPGTSGLDLPAKILPNSYHNASCSRRGLVPGIAYCLWRARDKAGTSAQALSCPVYLLATVFSSWAYIPGRIPKALSFRPKCP